MSKSIDWMATFKQAMQSGRNYATGAIDTVTDHGKNAVKRTRETAPVATREALETIRKGLSDYALSNPKEVKYMAGLGAAGLGGGIWIGGAIGVVGFFGAVGIPLAALGAIGGAIIGNRLGVQLDKKQLEELNAEQSERLFQLLLERDQTKIERVKTNEEHRQKLFQGMAEAKECLVILSGWATSYVIDKDFKDRLAACLQRGVNVYIGYGYQTAKGPKEKNKQEKQAEDNFMALMSWSEKQNTKGHIVVRYYPNHAKLLICDDKWLVSGSFNWLSNSGRSKNEEYSCVVKDKKFVSTELDIVVEGLMSPMKATRRDMLGPVTNLFKSKSRDDDNGGW